MMSIRYLIVCLIAWLPLAAHADAELPPLGSREKIRYFWCQWHHFDIPSEELIANVARVGGSVFADWGFSAERANLSHKHGMRYFSTWATAQLRGPVTSHNLRQAVDKFGYTCKEQFDLHKGQKMVHAWGDYGDNNKPAYVPCPLEHRVWEIGLIKPMIQHAKAGLLDGLNLDLEPYGAYSFDKTGEMLCYCDDCFSKYLAHKQLKDEVARTERYGWLEQRGELDAYLDLLRVRSVKMFKDLAAQMRAVHPTFVFSAYPDFVVEDLRADWRLQGLAVGLHSPQAPFIVVNSTPYWEDPSRPWWDGPHTAYRKLGIKHVMGSWAAGLMGHHKESHVGAAELMYELAMYSDGFWRWGERHYGTDDWRSFAMVNQRLRQVESKVGDYLFKGEPVDHFVTIVEQTGNPLLERSLISWAWKHKKRYLVRLFNGDPDFPIHVRVRFGRIKSGTWRIEDPMSGMAYTPVGGGPWSAEAMRDGLILPIEQRRDTFLVLQRTGRRDKPDRYESIQTFDVPSHNPLQKRTDPLPEPESAAGEEMIVYDRPGSGQYRGATAGQNVVVAVALADTAKNAGGPSFALRGYARQPLFSPDRKHVAAGIYLNGKGQIHVLNAVGLQARNISDNDACDRSPRFSPDGSRIVFVSDRDGDWDIYSMNTDGSDVQRLTKSPGVDRHPSYSPDGKRIAFISDRDGDFNVFVMNADGTGLRALVTRSGNEYEPTWSPDGRFIACTVQRRNLRRVELVEVDGKGKWILPTESTNLRSICFSPDGRKIAATSTNYGTAGVKVFDISSQIGLTEPETAVRQLIDIPSRKPRTQLWYSTGSASPRLEAYIFTGVSFSPDGSRLVYCSDHPLLVKSGEAQAKFEKLKADRQAQIDKLEPDKREGRDAEREVLQTLVDNERNERSFQLFTISVDGGDPTPINGTSTPWPVHTDWARR